MPVPSEMSTPSASRLNGRISPDGLRAPSWEKTDHRVTSWQWWTPPASTASQRPDRSSEMAASTAISELAQAASTVNAGPPRSRRLAIREAARFGTRPMADSGRSSPR